ncbi:MAG: response regulator [Planctomycetes bacterium]|nr:response regulator [Planctomycetota bacterium]
MRLIVGQILRDLGFDVAEAGHGQEALDRLRDARDTRLVLVDWNMPVMDGLEFVRAVRADRGLDPVRVVVVSTETEAAQVGRALAAGANEYVMKPFTRDVIAGKLELLGLS